MKREFEVVEGAATERLDIFLAARLSTTRSQAQRLLRSDAITVNNVVQRPNYQVQPRDKIIVDTPTVEPAQRIAAPVLSIVYEDDDLLVVEKPAGLVMHVGSGTGGLATLADFARIHTTDTDADRPGIVHRLDRDTSGLVIIAKTLQAKENLQVQFRDHTVHKTYTLLASGRVDPPEAVIRLPLDRDPVHPLRRAVVPGGRDAITRYNTLSNYPGYTLIEAHPETGRTHQIRVHFAAIGHPVAGDTLYGLGPKPSGLSRQFLHASKLEFITPSGKQLKLESPLPSDLATIINRFENQV